MEYALLRSLRALGPGLIILSYIDLFLVLVLGQRPYFWCLDSAKLLLLGYVSGGVFGVFTGYLNRDRHAFDGVNAATLSALQEFSPEVQGRSWRDVSPCFYNLIDNDKSLEQKSKGIYFNGFIVTTSFDAIWISLCAAAFGAGIAFWTEGWSFLVVAAFSSMLAYCVWRLAVKRHSALAADQVNVIKKRLASEFRSCVRGRAQDARSGA